VELAPFSSMAMERDFTRTGWRTVAAGNRCTFTAPIHGRNAYARKERFPSRFLDIESPSYRPSAERHGTISERVRYETRYGRFGVDAKLNKPLPMCCTRGWTSVPGPRAVRAKPMHATLERPAFPLHTVRVTGCCLSAYLRACVRACWRGAAVLR
jgi:hypothetical protein